MKKAIFVFSITFLLLFGNFNLLVAQDVPKPKKDTVNLDTYAKPEFYYAEDEKSEAKSKSSGAGTTIAIIVGVVVVISIGGYFFLKKKK